MTAIEIFLILLVLALAVMVLASFFLPVSLSQVAAAAITDAIKGLKK